MRSYQKEAWMKNRNTIIKLLNEKPLTFKELLQLSGLSRSVLNEHLKALTREGIVKKIYENGKILNVIQYKKLNLVEWFLSQLEVYVPRKVIEKGRQYLDEKTMFYLCCMYVDVLNDAFDLIAQSQNNKAEVKKATLLFSLKPIRNVIAKRIARREIPEIPKFKILGYEKAEREIMKSIKFALADLHPIALNVVFLRYLMEKNAFEDASVDDRDKLQKMDLFFYPYLPESFEKTADWWFNDVMPNLPSSSLLIALSTLYINLWWSRKVVASFKELEK